ncbi:MAG: SMC-Scp complex subunit ScpB [Burkholderiales bacterium]|jgi:segregation and condensation protein B
MDLNLELSHIEQVVEVCLLTATDPISPEQLTKVFDDQVNQSVLERIIFELGQKYANKGIELLRVANGYRFRSRLEFQPYINKLYQVKPPKYSRAIMETLAIITYRQPVTRGEIEDIRGVTINSNIIQILMDRGWIEVIGYKQVPGKPELLATTTKFLEDLGITSLQELPSLPCIDLSMIDTHQDLIEEYDQKKDQHHE